MTPRRSARILVTIMLTTLLAGHIAPMSSGAAQTGPRERPPYNRTPTPTSEMVAGDGTGMVEETTPLAVVVESGSPPVVQVATEVSVDQSSSSSAIRPRPEPRTFVNPASQADRDPKGTLDSKSDADSVVPRLDNSVLRWLPEIMASATVHNVPPELIAGVMRLESDGNPNIISPDGARGLMQVMPDEFYGQGIPDDLWHDPATNIMAGGYELRERSWSYGSWEQAVGSYFGFGCDVFGTCTAVYIKIVFDWAAYYKPIIASPLTSGFGVLPADWVAPPIVPFVEKAPTPPEEPPTETPTPGATETATSSATPTPIESPTMIPTESSGGEPTEAPSVAPTDVPTTVSTEEPTAVPTDEPTTEPTAVPTEEPTEVPTEEPTEPPVDDNSSETNGDSDADA